MPHGLHLLLDSLVMNPVTHLPAIRRALHTPPALEPEVFISNPAHSWSSPVSYVPQAIGIALGRAVNAPYLVDFYLGRFVNLVASVVVLMLAIRLFPSYRWFAVLIALTPMATHVRASLSADALTTGISFLFIALVTRAAFTDENVTPGRWFAITLLAGLLCLTKLIYVPIGAMALAIPRSRFPSAASALRSRIALCLVVLCCAMISSRIATYYWAPYRADVTTPDQQMKFILSHPTAFLHVLWMEHVVRAKWYLVSMVGDLGSGPFCVPLPKFVVILYFAVILLLLIGDTTRRVQVTPLQRLYLTFLCAGATFAVSLATYLIWCRVGADRIDGLQGRYYIPFVPAAAFIVHRSADGFLPRWRLAITVAAVALATCVAADLSVMKWYERGWHDWRSMAAIQSPKAAGKY
jgi:uncharacterized membrane protein